MLSVPVVGIDLSLTSTGLALVVDGVASVHRIRSKGAKGDDLVQRAVRLGEIRNQVLALTPPGAHVAIESPTTSSMAGSQHDRSGLWWLIVTALLPRPVTEMTPQQIKMYATGSGAAEKDAVLAAMVRRYPGVQVDGNDTADALAAAAMLCRYLGQPIEEKTPPLDHLRPIHGGRGSGKGRTAIKPVRWAV